MKKHLLFLGTCFLFLNAFSQIPNAGFENWVSKGNFNQPTGWWTTNFTYSETAVVNCERTTQHTEGQYAMKLISRYSDVTGTVSPAWSLTSNDTFQGDISWGFPCTSRPVSFKWDMMYYRKGADVGVIYIKFTKWDNVNNKRIIVAENFRQVTTTYTSWINCEMNISYNTSDIPDTCAIGMIASDETTAVDSTTLIVDNLRFNFGNNSINTSEQINDIIVYPTVANEKISILPNSEELTFSSVQIVDLQGKTVKQIPSETIKKGNKFDISLNGIRDGLYLIRLTSANRTFVKKFTKISN